MLHPYISPDIKLDKKYAPSIDRAGDGIKLEIKGDGIHHGIDIPELVESAKSQGQDIVTELGRYIPVREVVL